MFGAGFSLYRNSSVARFELCSTWLAPLASGGGWGPDHFVYIPDQRLHQTLMCIYAGGGGDQRAPALLGSVVILPELYIGTAMRALSYKKVVNTVTSPLLAPPPPPLPPSLASVYSVLMYIFVYSIYNHIWSHMIIFDHI